MKEELKFLLSLKKIIGGGGSDLGGGVLVDMNEN